MVSINSLSIAGYKAAQVPNTFFQQDTPTPHATIIFPGWGYTAQMPLLFYATQALLAQNADVLTVDYGYNRNPAFQACDSSERRRWFQSDVEAALQALRSRHTYTHLILIGKSIGTRALGHLVSNVTLPKQVDVVWLTPLLRDANVVQQMQQCPYRSLYISGTADPHYNAASIKEVQRATQGDVMLVDGADHSLNLKNDVQGSIEALAQVTERINTFVKEE